MTTKEAMKDLAEKKVIVYLLNGFQMKGTVEDIYEDGGLNISDSNGRKNIIPASAISTVQKYVV